jgi:hypothetical protein
VYHRGVIRWGRKGRAHLGRLSQLTERRESVVQDVLVHHRVQVADEQVGSHVQLFLVIRGLYGRNDERSLASVRH